MSTPELTPTQREMDSRDWTFGGTWPYEPRWLFTDEIRIHYVDEGPREGEPVVLLHGNPTWSYLYRNFINGLTEAGFRAVAHDQMGFGRSDKPERQQEYSIQRHARHFGALMDELGLQHVSLVIQDWGGPIGLAWAVDHPERVKRLVVLNTFTGSIPPEMAKVPLPFKLLRAPGTGELFVKGMHFFVRGILFKGGLGHPERLGPDERAAYLAPHPSWASRTGVLAYPRLIPWDKNNPTRPLGEHVDENLHTLTRKPALVCWPLDDPAFGPHVGLWTERLPGAEVHEFEDASHYIQEDAHERLVPLIIDFMNRTA